MKRWKLWQFCLFIVLCITLNDLGRDFTVRFSLPLWLDSFGTVLCAYVAGPVCGSILGVTSNLLYGMRNSSAIVYSLTSVTLGVVVGLSAKKGGLESIFNTMSVCALTTFSALLVSLPLNILFSESSTGNIWGDGVRMTLLEIGCPGLLADLLGQFYLEFLDKTLTLLGLFGVIRLVRLLRRRRAAAEEKRRPETGALLSAVLAAAVLGGGFSGEAYAAEDVPEATDYNSYVQTVYSSNNGLPCGEANDLAQTGDGILWIGTYAGLYRYNGREFRWMNEYDSVRNVNCLYVDEEGRLWIGTNDNGFSISIRERIVNVVDMSRGLPSNSVRSIIQGTDGFYYIGTTSSMQILTLNSGLKKVRTLGEINYADDSSADSRGNVAAVTSDGRLFLLNGGRILSSRQITNGQEVFKSCAFDRNGRLLAGTTGNSIYFFDISGEGFEELGSVSCGSLNSLKELTVCESGEVFICADNGVGYLDAGGSYHFINTNDYNASIDNMLVDYQGNLWFASSRLGLLRMAPSSFKDVYTTVGLGPQVVNTIVRWQDAYYFGTDKGLDVVDLSCRSQLSNTLTEQLENVRIRCMLVDSDNHLWICTYGGGLMEVEPDGTQYLYNRENGSFGNRARLVVQLSDGSILAGGDTGISFLRDHTVVHTIRNTDGLINSMILTATELPDGRIIAGTDGDGIAVLENWEVSRMLTRADGLSSEVILRTIPDPKSDGVFIVTSNGLCYMESSGDIRPLDNFPYFNNYDIWVRDPDTLFVMSSAGIYVVDRDQLLSGELMLDFELLDSRQGLNSALTANSWNYYDSEKGELFLPCDNGVFLVNAGDYASTVKTYRMTVASVLQDGFYSELPQIGPIMVDRGVGRIELMPEIINYTIEDPAVGYWLEGFDNGWTVLSQSVLSSATYTNLPPGNYVFHLAVFDKNQQILSERSYELVKEQEINDYPWFRIYLLGVPMLAVAWFTWFVARTRLQRALRRQERELAMAKKQIQMGNETIFAIAKAVDAKDERTSQHSLRVSQYSALIAEALGMPPEECEDVRRTALMHDIGKIGIPDRILNKPGRLTDEEYAIMKSHVTLGADILKDFTLIDHVVEGARYHHERYDGRGYPSGLKGEEIPLFGRIIGVADAFDAMTANRVYRKQMDFDYVLNEMRKGRGTQFDPHITDVFLQLIAEGKVDLNALYGVKEQREPQTAAVPGEEVSG